LVPIRSKTTIVNNRLCVRFREYGSDRPAGFSGVSISMRTAEGVQCLAREDYSRAGRVLDEPIKNWLEVRTQLKQRSEEVPRDPTDEGGRLAGIFGFGTIESHR
jgi:hypothetical protein